MLKRYVKSAIKWAFPKQVSWIQSRRNFWGHYLWYGEWELPQLAKYVPRDKLAVDVGGNVGVYAYHLSRFAEQVVVFEPNPVYFSMLAALNLKNVRIEHTALSSRSGDASLRVPSIDGRPITGMATLEIGTVPDANLHHCLEVSTRTLDSYGLRRVGFIKIDVEGHEESVIGGAMETITRDRPTLLIEIEERHNAGGLERLTPLFDALGYVGYFFEGSVRRDLKDFNPATHASLPDDSFKRITANRRSVSYINNFLFLQRGTDDE